MWRYLKEILNDSLKMFLKVTWLVGHGSAIIEEDLWKLGWWLQRNARRRLQRLDNGCTDDQGRVAMAWQGSKTGYTNGLRKIGEGHHDKAHVSELATFAYTWYKWINLSDLGVLNKQMEPKIKICGKKKRWIRENAMSKQNNSRK